MCFHDQKYNKNFSDKSENQVIIKSKGKENTDEFILIYELNTERNQLNTERNH